MLKQEVEKTLLQKEHPNNYLGYSNNNRGYLLPRYPNNSNDDDRGNGSNQIENRGLFYDMPDLFRQY